MRSSWYSPCQSTPSAQARRSATDSTTRSRSESVVGYRAPYWSTKGRLSRFGYASPVDVVRAVNRPEMAAVGAGPHLHDEVTAWNTGTWDLQIADGQGHLEPSSRSVTLRLEIEGFALLFTGAAAR